MKKKLFLFVFTAFLILTIGASAAVKPNSDLSATSSAKRLPDLVALSMNVVVKDGGALEAGKETMIGCSLKNNGGSFTKEFRIGIQLDGNPLGLPIGSTATPETTGFATPWTATPGNHTAVCKVDTQDVIHESNETNNVVTYRFTIPKNARSAASSISVSAMPTEILKPDITIEKIEVKAEDGGTVAPGKASRVYCYWKRTGPQPANPFNVVVKMDGTAIGSGLVDQTLTSNWIAGPWTAVAGNHQIYCEVDDTNEVVESNEKNNKWVQLYNLPGASIPAAVGGVDGSVLLRTDVLIEKIEVKTEDGSKLEAGKDARIFCYWKRTGAQPADDFRIAAYVDGTALGSALGSTVQHDRTDGWLGIPWKATIGTHSIKCFADSAFQITEPNEANNTKTMRLIIGLTR